MKAEKMPIASTDIVIISALDCTKMLIDAPTINTMIAPTNRNLPMPDRSRLITVDSAGHDEEHRGRCRRTPS